MTELAIHRQVLNLLLSTADIFQNFSVNDRKNLAVKDTPPETSADRQIAEYLSSELQKIVPGHGIIIEDHAPVIGNAGKSVWVIDPIDGTIPFMYHVPSYMVSIYELKDTTIKSAFAYNPSTQEIFYSDGVHSYCNNQSVTVSTRDSLVEARIALSGHTLETLPNLYSSLRQAGAYIIVQEGLIFRSSLVASGRIDATIQIGLRQFESGAVYSLVKNAGGEVRSIAPSSVDFLKTSPNVVISNAKLNARLVTILKEEVKRNE